nr:DUF4345 family protein [Cesiribacter sp. SM1]
MAYFFFYTYVGLMLVAGIWGAFVGAQLDQQMLFELDTTQLNSKTTASMLSQYRFLRLIEFGFGWFAIAFTREIFSEPKYNRLFLSVMFLGVLARTVSLFADGSPHGIFYLFAGWELVGVILIFIYTQKEIKHNGAKQQPLTIQSTGRLQRY